MITRAQLEKVIERVYLEGYKAGVTEYAVWKDGRQLVGIMQRPLEDVLKESERLPQFRINNLLAVLEIDGVI